MGTRPRLGRLGREKEGTGVRTKGRVATPWLGGDAQLVIVGGRPTTVVVPPATSGIPSWCLVHLCLQRDHGGELGGSSLAWSVD